MLIRPTSCKCKKILQFATRHRGPCCTASKSCVQCPGRSKAEVLNIRTRCPLLPQEPTFGGAPNTSASDESPGGISPPGAPKTVREPLDSHGSRCSTVGKRAAGFTSSTGSSCCQLASVGRWSRLNNAAPSVQLHYRAFVPTTSHSAPVLRIGTLVLAVVAACHFSLYIGAQVLTFRTKAWLSFAPPPCRMPLGPSQASPS